MSRTQLTSFFGWCSVLNVGLLCVSALSLLVMGDLIRPIHSTLLALPEAELNALYANWIATYKVLTFVLAIVPYLALKLIPK